MKICIVCAPGGHLTEMLRLNPAFQSNDTFIITNKEEFLTIPNNIKRRYLITNFLINQLEANMIRKAFVLLFQLLFTSIEQLRILLIEKPDIIISTGSEIAIPIFYFSRILGKKTIYIESICRMKDLSYTGKIVYPISSQFLVQWKSLIEEYEKARYEGNLLTVHPANREDCRSDNKSEMIFVTVGTAPFPRLIKKIDEIASNHKGNFIMQIGRTDYRPKNAKFFTFVNHDKWVDYVRNSKIIISHPGAGTLLDVMAYCNKIIVVPRLREYKEALDNPQNEIVSFLANRNIIYMVNNLDEIPNLLKELEENDELDNNEEIDNTEDNKIIDFLRDYLAANMR